MFVLVACAIAIAPIPATHTPCQHNLPKAQQYTHPAAFRSMSDHERFSVVFSTSCKTGLLKLCAHCGCGGTSHITAATERAATFTYTNNTHMHAKANL